jgi:hypothetical protein
VKKKKKANHAPIYVVIPFCQKKIKFSWVPLAHACNPSYMGSSDWGDRIEASLGKYFMRPHLQNNQNKWTGGMVQVAQLLCKH